MTVDITLEVQSLQMFIILLPGLLKNDWTWPKVKPRHWQLATPCSLVQRIMEGERTPCLFLPMLSHQLLLAWGTTLSSEDVTPFSGCSEPVLPSSGMLSLASHGTGPRLPPECVATVSYVSEND
jgi:hypothetical protein